MEHDRLKLCGLINADVNYLLHIIVIIPRQILLLSCRSDICYYLPTDICSDYLSAGGCPVIATHPFDQTAVLGKTVVFECKAMGAAPLTYSWLHNGSEMIPAQNQSRMQIVVKRHSKGEYSCLVENEFGTNKSDSATLITVGECLLFGLV